MSNDALRYVSAWGTNFSSINCVIFILRESLECQVCA